MAELQIISDAGRDAGRRRLVNCRCACGTAFVARLDNVKAGRVKRCPDCRHLPEIDRPTLELQPQPEPTSTVLPTNATPPADYPLAVKTVEWYRQEIATKDEAIRKLDQQLSALTVLLAANGVQPGSFDQKSDAQQFRETVLTANTLRKEKKRLENELHALESVKAKLPVLSPMQSVMQRAASLRGQKQ